MKPKKMEKTNNTINNIVIYSIIILVSYYTGALLGYRHANTPDDLIDEVVVVFLGVGILMPLLHCFCDRETRIAIQKEIIERMRYFHERENAVKEALEKLNSEQEARE